jgi:uroporphyrinogen-III synthase
MLVWITRSAPDNLRTARGLHLLGQRPLMVPVVMTVAENQPGPCAVPDAIVFSSVHAVRHFEQHDAFLAVRVFVASALVADAALARGYASVTALGDNEDMLADMIGHVLPAARILLLCGAATSGRFADRLRGHGCRVERQVVYRPMPMQDEALASVEGALDGIKAIVLHSRSGAERIVPMLQGARWHGSLWCISKLTTGVCADLNRISIHTAAHPSEASLFDMIARLTPETTRRRARASRSNAPAMLGRLGDRKRSDAPNDYVSSGWRPGGDEGPGAA